MTYLRTSICPFFLLGSEGKLTSADQRIGVMQGIYGMSFHVVSGSTQVQNLSSSVCELFIPILSQEGKNLFSLSLSLF